MHPRQYKHFLNIQSSIAKCSIFLDCLFVPVWANAKRGILYKSTDLNIKWSTFVFLLFHKNRVKIKKLFQGIHGSNSLQNQLLEISQKYNFSTLTVTKCSPTRTAYRDPHIIQILVYSEALLYTINIRLHLFLHGCVSLERQPTQNRQGRTNFDWQ